MFTPLISDDNTADARTDDSSEGEHQAAASLENINAEAEKIIEDARLQAEQIIADANKNAAAAFEEAKQNDDGTLTKRKITVDLY